MNYYTLTHNDIKGLRDIKISLSLIGGKVAIAKIKNQLSDDDIINLHGIKMTVKEFEHFHDIIRELAK
jgi:hypothetical protein